MRRANFWFQRVLAGFCAVLMFATCVYIPAVSVETADTTIKGITHNGKPVSQVTLPQDGKLRLMAQTAFEGDVGYSWQIRDPELEDSWVNISGAHSDTLWVTYAMVGSMLEADGTAKLRCRLREGEVYRETDPVQVTVSFMPQEETVGSTAKNAPKLRMMRSAIRNSDSAENEYITHSIVINYLFDNNALAFEPYGATVADANSLFLHR